MNKLSIILICFIVLGLIFGGLTYLRLNELYNQSETSNNARETKIVELNAENAKLIFDNTGLLKTSNLKSFETQKVLQRFLADANSPKEVTSKTYASETCFGLMREAKEKGYWLGITVINTTNESVWTALLKDRVNPRNDVKWAVYAIAIVGDSELYLIDPQDITTCIAVVSLTGDFSNYNKSGSNISNLRIY